MGTKVSRIDFCCRFLTSFGTPGGPPGEFLGKYFHVFSICWGASMRHACRDRFFIKFFSLKASKRQGLSMRKSLICIEKTRGFIEIQICSRSCFETRYNVAVRAVLGGFGRPPGDGFGSEIDFQNLFSKHNIYKAFLS